MRFASIEINNYRQYKSLRIEFDKGPHDLQVIIGENGTGKTNLLNAFTWCLYGIEPHLGMDDKRRGEPKLNKDAIREALARGSDNSVIEVTIELELGKEIDRITRKLPILIRSRTEILEKKAEETFTVQRMPSSGPGEVIRSDRAVTYIDRRLPEGIREYFFFDGEQLSNYFSDRRSSAIKSAIHSISQIDVVSRMRDRTQNTVKQLRRGMGNTMPNIKALNDELEKSEELARKTSALIDDYERQAREAKETIEELDVRLRGIPDIAALEVERDNLRSKARDCEADINNARAEYISFARNSYIDFAFYDAAIGALTAISQMENEHQLPPAIDRGYIEEMLRDHVCKVCGRPLSEHDQKYLEDVLKEYQVSSETSHVLISMRSELRRLEERVRKYPQSRDRVTRSLKRAEASLDDVMSRLNEVERIITTNPDSERIKLWYSQRAELEIAYGDYREKIGERKKQLQLRQKTINRLDKELKDAMRKQSKQRDLTEAIDFGMRAVEILSDVEKDVIDEVRRLMSQKTETLFKGLVWKGSKCDHIDLSESYQLSLYDKTGYSCAATCSAAERALLALSFTLAMHEVSGFESPLFIDTPIARASGENRANFADTLAEVSKNKQLILTFTPDEYSESIASVFDPIAASNMHLILDDAEQVVTLRRH